MAIKYAGNTKKRGKDGLTKLERQRKLLTGEIPISGTANAALVADTPHSISGMISDAARKLATAKTAADVLDAKGMAGVAYDAAKLAARFAKAKGAADKVVAAAHRAQADALEIEASAKRRLADEYDGAQDRGEIAKGRPKTIPDGNTLPTAAEIGVSGKEIMDARQIRDAIAANPDAVKDALAEILDRGDEPTRAALKRVISPAVKVIRSERQAEKKVRRGERETILAEKIRALPDGKFGVIVADPEWKFDVYSEETGMDRAAANHYPTSDLLTIMQRDIGSIAAKDAICFLWIPVSMLVEGICVLDAWGFALINRNVETGFLEPDKSRARYVSSFAWLKEKIITGYWTRGKHEVLLIATRGNPVAPAMGDQLPSWLEGEAVVAASGEHSAKPEIFLEWIEKMWPNVPKIELNRRGPAREGWAVWGNEAEEAA
jgi:N6-adenosine-specific RNA methylase IME4